MIEADGNNGGFLRVRFHICIHWLSAVRGIQMQSILDGYAAAATPDFIAAYDGLSSECIYEHVSDLFPDRRVRMADIGAGTGRDAAWFAHKGHDVLAVEPVRELREAGQALHGSKNITWVDDHLPQLRAVRRYEPFDLVTLCAVWQHLSDEERRIAVPRLARAIAASGLLVMSLRHGPGAYGREIFPVSPGITIEMARACGLRLLRKRNARSVQASNRATGVSWTWLAFEKLR